MTETQAQVRPTRAALRLRRVVSAEEVAEMPVGGVQLDEQAFHIGLGSVIMQLPEQCCVSRSQT